MNDNKPGWIKRTWRVLRTPSTKFSLLTLLVVGFISGIIFWGGYNTAMSATNTLAFCTSCHEMQENFKEYKETIHYKNEAGVRAICSDCHVPKAWFPMFIHKIKATHQLWGHLMGVIDTPAKFEAERKSLAEGVWKEMKANNSQECRNCHHFKSMALDKQGHSAAKHHSPEYIAKTGKTCIDCHKGIAHHLPEGM